MSEILWTNSDLSEALQTPVQTQLQITGVSIDSRKIKPGDLFIALKGPNFDGHNFLADAASKGAVAAIVEKPGDAPASLTQISVRNAEAALTALGKFARKRFTGKIIGVTGSVGKTGTKEALAHILSRQGKTFANEGNLNNHLGVPLSLSRMPRDAAFAIIEMGMNHPGEIAPLSELCEPFVGIVTAVSPAHIEFFPNGLEGIADEKAQIVAGMNSQSVAIFNRDTPLFERMSGHAAARKIGRVIGFGKDPLAQARLLNCNLHAASSDIEADILGQKLSYTLNIPGLHIAMNSLAVLAAAQSVGADIAKAAKDLADLRPTSGRGLRRQIAIPGGEIELIDESYNASPDAMRGALDVLSRAQIMPNARRIAVLGDMRELGTHSVELHTGLAPAILAANPDLVMLCGPYMAHLHPLIMANIKTQYAPDSATLAAFVTSTVKPGDVVMVKGSLGTKMRVIIEALDNLRPTLIPLPLVGRG
ncbi:MAG: UDP-N-acetylmuramoyl-tripeptide--D-alanyl-D-alanine ligase [Alphaproteobacteria bacterium]|nr:MAG: UDP-N-acetylmuramoyl-tripeptide--D-alanyl-D-alanine ligase [Alphaproteobacteria bacterium]